ncbi:MAG: hypothetical protein EXR77_16715 [Myxococcales bacterium]|nr:hypothetical protein [Myxococcales bacterium]
MRDAKFHGPPLAVSKDAGQFYCEHVYFAAQIEAALPTSSVCRNSAGEVLVGFLHVPPDRLTTAGSTSMGRRQGRRWTRALVVQALCGWDPELEIQLAEQPRRVLLTGFGNWGVVIDNPSGAFVATRVRTHKLLPRSVQWFSHVLPVSDAAVDGGPASIQQAIRACAPHVVISLGVATQRAGYSVEVSATDGGFDSHTGSHIEALPPRTTLPDNWALAKVLGLA